MTASGTATMPPWWPTEARACHADLVSYRLVGAGACADRITTALEALAGAAQGQGFDVSTALADARDVFCALKPDTALYLNTIDYLIAGERLTAETVTARVATLRAHRDQAQQRVVKDTADLLESASTVLVHDYSSMVSRVLDELGRRRPRRVVVTAGEPLGQGLRVARATAAAGHEVTFVPDATVGRHATAIDAFVTGVETFYGDGSFANTVGTLGFALLCREFGSSVVAPAECLKLHCHSQGASPEELTARLLHPWPADVGGIDPSWRVDDHVLDAVPGRLVTSYVTENGPCAADEAGDVASRVIATLLQLRHP